MHKGHSLRFLGTLIVALTAAVVMSMPHLVWAQQDSATSTTVSTNSSLDEVRAKLLEEIRVLLLRYIGENNKSNFYVIPVNVPTNNDDDSDDGVVSVTEGGNNNFVYNVGDKVRVVNNLNVRGEASVTGALRGAHSMGTMGVITGGPVVKDGYKWYEVNYDSSPDGWSASNWLTLVARGTNGNEYGETLVITNVTDGLSTSISDVREVRALERCKEEIGSGSNTKAYSCTWNGKEIYRVFSTVETKDPENSNMTCDSLLATPGVLPNGSGEVNIRWKTTGAVGVTLWKVGDRTNLGSSVVGSKPRLSVDDSIDVDVVGTQKFELHMWNSDGEAFACPQIQVTDTSDSADEAECAMTSPLRCNLLGKRVKGHDIFMVRSSPSINGSIKGGQGSRWVVGTVIDGPIEADGYRWYNIDWESGADGWSVSNWLDLAGEAPKADLKLYKEGVVYETIEDITQADALAKCKEVYTTSLEAPAFNLSCTWDGQSIQPISLSNDGE